MKKPALIPSCHRIPLDCKRATGCRIRQCRRRDSKLYTLPRRFSPRECRKGARGFTMRASCAPYRRARTSRKTSSMKRDRTATSPLRRGVGSDLNLQVPEAVSPTKTNGVEKTFRKSSFE